MAYVQYESSVRAVRRAARTPLINVRFKISTIPFCYGFYGNILLKIVPAVLVTSLVEAKMYSLAFSACRIVGVFSSIFSGVL